LLGKQELDHAGANAVIVNHQHAHLLASCASIDYV
jgi:hypothetical protein